MLAPQVQVISTTLQCHRSDVLFLLTFHSCSWWGPWYRLPSHTQNGVKSLCTSLDHVQTRRDFFILISQKSFTCCVYDPVQVLVSPVPELRDSSKLHDSLCAEDCTFQQLGTYIHSVRDPVRNRVTLVSVHVHFQKAA